MARLHVAAEGGVAQRYSGGMREVTLYVELVNEGVDVWRPVDAVQVEPKRYRLPDTAPDGEEWVTPPGTVVVAVTRTMADGPALAASPRDDPKAALEDVLERNPHDGAAR